MLQAHSARRPVQLITSQRVLGLILLCLLALWPAAAGADRKPATPPRPVSPLDAPGWSIDNEWLIGGNYVEVSDDLGICPGLFGAPSCGGTSRKAIVLQITDGHYKSINLKSLCAVMLVESPPGEALLGSNRSRWTRAELLLPEAADSLQAEALARTIGATFNGLDGPSFDRIARVPLGVGIARERVRVNADDRLEILLRPLQGGNPVNPPQLQNQSQPFSFLGYVTIARADTLFARPGDGSGDWTWSGTAGFISTFGWSRQRAEEVRSVKR